MVQKVGTLLEDAREKNIANRKVKKERNANKSVDLEKTGKIKEFANERS